jgi:transcriptional regulator with XRE-family HTH domain
MPVVERLTAGEAIREFRTARGLSARQLSLQAGQSESYVGKIESGMIEPSLKGFAKIAMVLKLKPLEIHTILAMEAGDE